MRFSLESPDHKIGQITILAEGGILILAYLLLFLCLDAGINTIIISILVFAFTVYLAFDLTVLYLESRFEYPEEELAQEYEGDSAIKAERAITVSAGNFSRRQSSLNHPTGSINPTSVNHRTDSALD